MRVLVVDDDPDFRMMLRMQLEYQYDIDVLGEAGDGGEALALLGDGMAPDVVILDLMMPGMDGYEAIVHMRADHPDVPIVAYTAVAGQVARDHCDHHGVPLIRKSGDTSVLVQRLEELAGGA